MDETGQHTHEPMMQPTRDEKVNGIDVEALHDAIDAIKADPSMASCKFFAGTQWRHGMASQTKISHYELGGETIPQQYTIAVDEPSALLGSDTAPNPQMLLFAALNTCVLNTFVANAAANGVRLDSVEIDLEGELDLRGFLGIDDSVNPGYNEVTMVCRVQGDGTDEEYEKCLEAGTKHSPNFQNISRKVKINYRIES